MTTGQGLFGGPAFGYGRAVSWALNMDRGWKKVMTADAARRRFFFVSDFKKLHVSIPANIAEGRRQESETSAR